MIVQVFFSAAAVIFSSLTLFLVLYPSPTDGAFASVAALCAAALSIVSPVIWSRFYRKGRASGLSTLATQASQSENSTFPELRDKLRALLPPPADGCASMTDLPVIADILSSQTLDEAVGRLQTAQRRMEKAEKLLTLLSEQLLIDCRVFLPLADAVMGSVPEKTEAAAMVLLEKFMVVRDASSKTARSAAELQKELDDNVSVNSVLSTAEQSRLSVQEERSVIRELAVCIRENNESLQAMGREIHSGLELLKNITEITERSKLIAFNMSIEAARMGEKGRGFKVIIVELHKLNERTFDFSHKVAELLGRFRQYNTVLVSNMDEKASAVITKVEKGMDAAEHAVESLITAVSRTGTLTKEVATMSQIIDHDLDGILESLQFQDITRQMIEGAQGILELLRNTMNMCLSAEPTNLNQQMVEDRFRTIKNKLISEAKTNGEKQALMEVRL